MVKRHIPELSQIMLRIINQSLSEGVFPDRYKLALIAPRLKKPSLDVEDVSNYRPISNLDFLSKILERVVAEQLMVHLDRNRLNEDLQSAYRKAHSTETALVRVHDDIMRAMERKKVVLLVLIDLSAAFDTVSHKLLLKSLHRSGVNGVALKWFESYITTRQQTVAVNGHQSDPTPLHTGVPQGSVLGPILFNVYTTSLGKLLQEHNVSYHLYADDAQVYISTAPEELDDAIRRLESCIADVQLWMNRRQLKMNDTKTEFVVLRNKSLRIQPPCLRVGNHNITPSDSVRNIGVTFDNHMDMEQHVKNMCRQAFIQLRHISRLRPVMDRRTLECIVHAFISSRLDFSNAVLCAISQKLLRKLQSIQNSAARILMRCHRFDHITPVLHQLHWLPVSYRIRFKICVLVYKCLNNTAPGYLCDLIHLFLSARNTRRNDQLFLDVPFTVSAPRSFSTIAPRLWNDLPVFIRSSTSLDTFKSRLKTHYFIMHFN